MSKCFRVTVMIWNVILPSRSTDIWYAPTAVCHLTCHVLAMYLPLKIRMFSCLSFVVVSLLMIGSVDTERCIMLMALCTKDSGWKIRFAIRIRSQYLQFLHFALFSIPLWLICLLVHSGSHSEHRALFIFPVRGVSPPSKFSFMELALSSVGRKQRKSALGSDLF